VGFTLAAVVAALLAVGYAVPSLGNKLDEANT